MSSTYNWEHFISENLLSRDIVDGLCLVTHQGTEAYSFGRLVDCDKKNWLQFISVFKYATDKHDQQVFLKGFSLEKGRTKTQYNIYQKTYCSAYAMSQNKSGGLVVCNLPYSVLVCTYGPSQPPGTVIKVIEEFCTNLRASAT